MVNELIQRVRAELAKPGVTKIGFAKDAGLHVNTFKNLERDDWSPNFATLRKIEDELRRRGEKPERKAS